jgi:hypothetical protein
VRCQDVLKAGEGIEAVLRVEVDGGLVAQAAVHLKGIVEVLRRERSNSTAVDVMVSGSLLRKSGTCAN